jgi:hypothetical protein
MDGFFIPLLCGVRTWLHPGSDALKVRDEFGTWSIPKDLRVDGMICSWEPNLPMWTGALLWMGAFGHPSVN